MTLSVADPEMVLERQIKKKSCTTGRHSESACCMALLYRNRFISGFKIWDK